MERFHQLPSNLLRAVWPPPRLRSSRVGFYSLIQLGQSRPAFGACVVLVDKKRIQIYSKIAKSCRWKVEEIGSRGESNVFLKIRGTGRLQPWMRGYEQGFYLTN